MYAAGPGPGWWWLALAAGVPLMWAAAGTEQRWWRAWLLTAAGVLPLWLAWEWWVLDVSELGMAPLAVIVSLLVAAYVPLVAWLRRRLPGVPWVVLAATAWTGMEFARGEIIMDGYAWGFAAHPLIDAPVLAAPAAWGGFYLVSLLVALLGAAMVDARARPARAAAVGAAVLGLCAAAWWGGKDAPAGEIVKVAAVQTNLPQSNKLDWTLEDEVRDMARFEALTRRASEAGPALIAWPETMMPGLTLEPDAVRVLASLEWKLADGSALPGDAFARRLASLQQEIGVPMLVGEEARVGTRVERGRDGGLGVPCDRRYNSVYVVAGGRVGAARYDKVRLTPFGETMPYIRAWPWLQQQMLDLGAGGMTFDLSAGSELTVFEVGRGGTKLRAVTPVCFESTEASLCRRMVYEGGERRADLIVNVTNDGWFGASRVGRLQHLHAARWRSLETGTPTLRAANTGVSAVIDRRGGLIAAGVDGAPGAMWQDGVLTASVELPRGATAYAFVGDAAGWGSLGVLGGLVALGLVKGRVANSIGRGLKTDNR
ncbi:MAG: apolipoprotein N-acyltransferase [Leptolyngbya sp. PLA1]|nr:apolipoprotein N-acyltransferase [Leptolyngbya sp. PLA1]